MAALFGQAAGAEFVPSRNGKTLVTRKTSTVRLIEKGNYRLLFGAARTPKEGEEVSGDNYMFRNTLPGQVALSLSDGMGSGPAAGADSGRVMELAEQLLDTGFSARSTLKLINTVLLLSGMGDRPATLDLGLVNLYTGVLEMMKLGAAASFLLPDRRSGGEAEILESETVPAGVLNPVEPGDDIAETLGRGQDHPGERRCSRCDAGGGKGADFPGFPRRAARRRCAGDGGDDPDVCAVV